MSDDNLLPDNNNNNRKYTFYIRWFYLLLFIFLVLWLYIIVYSYIIKPKHLSNVWPYDVEINSIIVRHKDIDKRVAELLKDKSKDQLLLECLIWLRNIDMSWINSSWSLLENTNCIKERNILIKKN